MIKSNKKRRQRPNKSEQLYRHLCRWHDEAVQLPEEKRKDDPLLRFVLEAQKGHKERGDHYLGLLREMLPYVGPSTPIDKIPNKVLALASQLQEYKTDRLNYDDMREALAWIVNNRAIMYFIDSDGQASDFIRRSKALEAIAGAPASDIGRMRAALKLADTTLTDMVKGMDEKIPREVVTSVWDLIHAARRALASAPPPSEVEKIAALHTEWTKKYVDTINSVRHAITAFDGSAFVPTAGTRAAEIIMEAVSLRAFLAERERWNNETVEQLEYWLGWNSKEESLQKKLAEIVDLIQGRFGAADFALLTELQERKYHSPPPHLVLEPKGEQ